MPCAAGDGRQRVVGDGYVEAGFASKQVAEPAQERAAADEHQSVVCDVGRELRRCSFEDAPDRIDDLGERSLKCVAYEIGVDRGATKQPSVGVATGDLPRGGYLDACDRAPDFEFERLGLLLADDQSMLVEDGAHDRFIELVPTNTDRVRDDHAAKRGDRHLARPAADVDDQGAARFSDRQPRSDRGRERLIDQEHARGARSQRRLLDRAPLDLGDPARHADDHLRPRRESSADAPDELPQHLLGHVEVGDHAVPERPDCTDMSGRATNHPSRLITDRKHLRAQLIDRHHRRLEQDDPLATAKDDRVRGAEIDRKLARRPASTKPHNRTPHPF